MELPGAACIWASYSYSDKAYVKLATPIVVALLLGCPVVAAWMMLKHAAAKRRARGTQGNGQPSTETDMQQEIMWRHRYDRTVDVFWNNIVSSLERIQTSMLAHKFSVKLSLTQGTRTDVLALPHLSRNVTHYAANIHLPTNLQKYLPYPLHGGR